jgi:hypothetical protein
LSTCPSLNGKESLRGLLAKTLGFYRSAPRRSPQKKHRRQFYGPAWLPALGDRFFGVCFR